MKCWLIALLVVAGCSPKPQQVEVIIKTEPNPEMTVEEKAANEKLKLQNNLNQKALEAYNRLSNEGTEKKIEDKGIALIALDREVEVIKERDGPLAAAKFFHDETVGKSIEEFVATWAPRYQAFSN